MSIGVNISTHSEVVGTGFVATEVGYPLTGIINDKVIKDALQ